VGGVNVPLEVKVTTVSLPTVVVAQPPVQLARAAFPGNHSAIRAAPMTVISASLKALGLPLPESARVQTGTSGPTPVAIVFLVCLFRGKTIKDGNLLRPMGFL
jgi:hypothetical protein